VLEVVTLAPGTGSRLQRGNHLSIAGHSSESLIMLVNMAECIEAESKPADARWPPRLGAAGFTARRGR
jgi:hypothetical protein